MTQPTSPFDRAEMKRAVAKWAIDSGGRLAKRRGELGLSRDQLAGLAGIAEPTITRIESGTINPRDDLRWILAGVLQVSVDSIWTPPTREIIAAERSLVAS
jgi:transcriptional regulator with XRE-family HTH domain